MLFPKPLFNFKKIIVLGILAILLIGRILINVNGYTKKIVNSVKNISLNNSSIALPFEDLTIPYLRSRSYKSKLNDLSKISDNYNYSSYLTSYSSDGLKINALLTIPKSEKPKSGYPAIVFVHGYIPPSDYKTTERYVDYVDYLARNGFVVFKIDLRGNGNSEGQPTGAYFSSGYVIDTLNAYSALQHADFVNSRKIGLWGHSMAGNIVMRVNAVNPNIPVTVIWAGAVYTYIDQREYGIHDLSYRPPQVTTSQANIRQSIFQKVGTPSATNNFWKEVAPTSYLIDFRGAIQIHHALDDTVVDIKYSENLNSILNKTKIPHEFFKYENGGHNISGLSFNLAMKRTVEFFNKYLK